MSGALFPGHVILPESVWQCEQWEAGQVRSHLERIRKAAEEVFAYQWHDNDEDAVKALEALRAAINGT